MTGLRKSRETILSGVGASQGMQGNTWAESRSVRTNAGNEVAIEGSVGCRAPESHLVDDRLKQQLIR